MKSQLIFIHTQLQKNIKTKKRKLERKKKILISPIIRTISIISKGN